MFEGGSDGDDQMGTFPSFRVEVSLAAMRANEGVVNLQHQIPPTNPRIAGTTPKPELLFLNAVEAHTIRSAGQNPT